MWVAHSRQLYRRGGRTPKHRLWPRRRAAFAARRARSSRIGPFPAVILVHGGGWVTGDRMWNVEPLFTPLLDAGFACLSISYRLVTEIPMIGAAVKDVESAVSFVTANAGQLGVDPGKLALIGESAGGQLAAMAILGGSCAAVNAAVLLYAPVDLERLAGESGMIPGALRRAAMDGPLAGFLSSRLRDLSPIHRVRAGMPPLLLIHGTADPLVPFDQSRDMCKAVRKAGSSCDLVAVNGGGHGLRRWEQAGLTGYKRLMTGWLREKMSVLD